MKLFPTSSLRFLQVITGIFSVFILSGETTGQIDTVRNYFQNGNVHSEFPTKDGVTVGTVRYFYVDGSIKTLSTFNGSSKIIHQLNFDKQGIKRSESGTTPNGSVWRKNFNEKGDLVHEVLKDSNCEETKIWYDNGILKSQEYFRDGFPIGCIKYEKGDKVMLGSEEICYCWNVRVKWKDSNYVTLNGETINLDYYWHKTTYYENGSKESEQTQEGKKLKIREWDFDGLLRKDTITSIKGETTLIPYSGENSTVFIAELEEGGPILKTPNPFRDTTIQRYSLTRINDSTIQISLWECYYDSLAQEYWHGFDFTVYKIENTSILPYSNLSYKDAYTFYSVGNQEYGVIVGINKTNKNEIIFHSMDNFWITSIPYNLPIKLYEK